MRTELRMEIAGVRAGLADFRERLVRIEVLVGEPLPIEQQGRGVSIAAHLMCKLDQFLAGYSPSNGRANQEPLTAASD